MIDVSHTGRSRVAEIVIELRPLMLVDDRAVCPRVDRRVANMRFPPAGNEVTDTVPIEIADIIERPTESVAGHSTAERPEQAEVCPGVRVDSSLTNLEVGHAVPADVVNVCRCRTKEIIVMFSEESCEQLTRPARVDVDLPYLPEWGEVSMQRGRDNVVITAVLIYVVDGGDRSRSSETLNATLAVVAANH